MNAHKQWECREDGIYVPSYQTTNRIPAGVYEIRKTGRDNDFYIKRQNIVTEGIIDIPIPEMKNIMADMKRFWEKEEEYKKSKMVFKRGYLLYGCPGGGKSVIIQRLIKHVIEQKDGIIINLCNIESIEYYVLFAPEILRSIEPQRKLMVVMEDLDYLIWRGGIDTPALLLNILDGLHQLDGGTIYVASTNYPEKLDAPFKNRPGRFDVIRKIGLPNEEAREYFFQHKLNEEQIKKIDMQKWVFETSGLSIAHIKELIISVLVLDHSFEKSIENLRKMKDFKSSREDTIKEIGF